MLFLLTNTHTGAKIYLLKAKYEVGRKNCDFLIENDLSISRKHAVIEVEDNKVTVTDAASKYKSFLNGEEMKPNVACSLKHGDEIQFGVYNSKFRLEQQKFVTTATRLSSAEKTQLKNEIEVIYGSYVEDWSHDCTHLTVKEIALTVKVLYALIDDKPIIMPQYWTKLKRHVTLGEEFPKLEDYSNPPVNEALLSRVEWKREINRTNLFKNKLFVFLAENIRKTMEGVIARLGGTSIAWEKNPMPLEDVEKSPKQIIVIQPTEKTQNSSFQKLTRLVLAKGQRLIPQQEIALAVVSGNCEKDCNPEFDRASEVFCNISRHTPSQSTIVAQNTESQSCSQDLCKVKEEKTGMVIDATFSTDSNTEKPDKISSSVDSNMEENKSEAFKRPNDIPITNVSKKIRTEDIEWTTSTSNRNEPTEIMQSKYNEANEDSSHANPQKRKASLEIEEENSPTRNPFLSIGKKVKREKRQDENNPFIDLTRGAKEYVQPDLRKNPFFRPRTVSGMKEEQEDRKTANILSSTANSVLLEQPSLEYSRISTSDENLNATWFSKKAASTAVEVKKESEYDDYFVDTEIRNLFKNTVVIDCTLNLVVKRNKPNIDRVDGSGNNGKVNFKKFKKVLPLHAQRTLMNQTAKVSFTLENRTATTSGAEPLQIFNDNDEDDNVDIRPAKRRVKKLVL